MRHLVTPVVGADTCTASPQAGTSFEGLARSRTVTIRSALSPPATPGPDRPQHPRHLPSTANLAPLVLYTSTMTNASTDTSTPPAEPTPAATERRPSPPFPFIDISGAAEARAAVGQPVPPGVN
jgi:hypothetical protein